MKHYEQIFFDLDHTLWDHDANARETIKELYEHYGFSSHDLFSDEELVSTFISVNDMLWEDFNSGLIKKSYLRLRRFEIIFDRLRLPLQYRPQDISKRYINACPYKTNLIPGAHELLSHLKGKGYPMHIITNGFTKIQDIKLTESGIKEYFDVVVTSEDAKSKKPFQKIFDHAVKLAGAVYKDSIMIGDNLKADIIGAREVGMDQIYFNPKEYPHDEEITHEVQNLTQVKSIV